MAESSASITQKLFSFRMFLQPKLIPAACFGVIAAGLLGIVLISTGIVADVLSYQGSAADTHPGIAPLLDRLDQTLLSGVSKWVRARYAWTGDAIRNVYLLAGIIAVCLPLRWILTAAATALVEQNSASVIQRIRQAIHRKAIRLEPADLTGEQARATDRLFGETATSLENIATDWGRRWISALPDLLVCCVLGLCLDWRLTLQVVIPVILCWFALGLETRRTETSGQLLQEQVNRGLKRLAESLRKTRIVCGFSMEQTESAEFEKNLNQYQARRRLLTRQQKSGWWIQRLLFLFCIVVPGVLLARQLLVPDRLSWAAATITGLIAVTVYRSFNLLRDTLIYAAEGTDKADELSAYVSRVPLVGQIAGARFLEPMSRTLQFDQVNLSIPNQPALLRNLDLRINSGDRVALLALNPLAPYALASMIPRFSDPDSGQVLIDGQDIRQVTLESLRAEAIFVGGDDSVFNATVLQNITCGQEDITRHQVQEACKMVHADNFIRQLPKGYDTVIGEHGLTLDPGQVFRLSLARAAVRQPALLIIQEPVVPLDSETKAMLDDAYQRLCQGRTVVFLPTRLSTVKRCGRVIMIHEGKVVADGPHETLVRSHDVYRHWEYTNFNEFREDLQPE